jgi:hypothetical protein
MSLDGVESALRDEAAHARSPKERRAQIKGIIDSLRKRRTP